MRAFIAAKARAGAASRAHSLLACAGIVWMWPGVPLSERRGVAGVPVASDVARFWISRLHGPAADEARALRCIAEAARELNEGDEAGAQLALNASGLTRLSPDGAALVRALARALGIAPLHLPSSGEPRPWRADDIAAHVPLFKQHARAALLLVKAGGWDESKHPRVPAGSPGGGQLQGAQGGGVREGRSVSPGIGHNGGPPLEPPEVPEKEPPPSTRYGIIKEVARWAAQALKGEAVAVVERALHNLEAIAWINRLGYHIILRTALDNPKSLEELQRAINEPAPGYQIHHIVEQQAAADDGYSQEKINSPDNLVRIPTMKHREITGWYMTPSDLFNGLSPREYLRGKSWDTRRKVGIDALIDAGVLKP